MACLRKPVLLKKPQGSSTEHRCSGGTFGKECMSEGKCLHLIGYCSVRTLPDAVAKQEQKAREAGVRRSEVFACSF